MSKIREQVELAGIVNKARKDGKTVGFTNGCFDILHLGHVKYLNKAKANCDILVVGVNSDASVKRIKGEERPVNPGSSRVLVLAALEDVDYVTVFEEDTPQKLIELLTPSVIFKGADWDEKDIVGAEYVKAAGGKVERIQYEEGFSTTDIIKRIKGKE